MEKQEFEFALDVKCTVWQRTRFTIEAHSLEEAKQIFHEASDEEREHLTYRGVPEEKTISYTTEWMSPKDNDGQEKEVWMSYKDGEIIINNAPQEAGE